MVCKRIGRMLISGAALLITGIVHATVTTVPDSALIPSTGYYTDAIGGGIGNIVVMTGGGADAGIGDPTGRNDDGFSGPIPLGFTLTFFGTNYTQFWANNNGNISFGTGIAAFIPNGPIGAGLPVISPFFADVYTITPFSGVMHLRTDIPNEIIITWDQVAYFPEPPSGTQTDSFQLVLRGPGFSIPPGEGQVGFFYKTMQWEVGNAGAGVAGFCGNRPPPCLPAAIGFGDGQSNGFVLQGSVAPGIASIVNNHHIWFTLSNAGMPTAVSAALSATPAPDTLGLLAFGLAGLGFWQWYARKRHKADNSQ